MGIQVVNVQREQIEVWLRLGEAVYTGVDHQFHQQEIEQILADDDKHCFLAIADDGEPCGMIEVSLRNVVDGCLTSPVGYIEGIFVDAEYRGVGVARQLLQRGQQWCREKGCTELGTDAELNNEQAQKFHRHMGFEETYRTVGYRKPL